jgi:hypothetical protein
MHAPTLYTVSAPDRASLSAFEGNFGEGDRAFVPGYGAFRYYETPPALSPVGSVDSVIGGTWVPEANLPIVETTYEDSQPVVPGRVNYRLPVGHYVGANAADLRAFHNGNELAFGGDWGFYHSGMNNPPWSQPASVSDLASGIFSAGGPYPPGIITLRWVERTIAIRPRTIIPVNFVGAPLQPRTGLSWRTSQAPVLATDYTSPNGISVPAGPAGYQLELWRTSKKIGGKSKAGVNSFFSHGRRPIPYFRGPQPGVADPFSAVFFQMTGVFPFVTQGATFPFGQIFNQKKYYRACYYNPTTRVRSEFAVEQITMFAATTGDRHNMDIIPGDYRVLATIAISPS